MDIDEAEKERKQGDIIKLTDPNQQYFLYPVKVCKVNQSLLGKDNPENNIKSCKKSFRSDLDSARAVQYIYGGVDLKKLTYTAEDTYPLFKGMTNLFQGLFKLQQDGVSHNDIKPENIVYLKQSDDSFLIRFVDIGFVQKNKEEITHPFDSDYYAWPYEMRLTVEPQLSVTQKSVDDWHGANRHDSLGYLQYDHFFNPDGSRKLTKALAEEIVERLRARAKQSVTPLNTTGTPKEKARKQKKYDQEYERKLAEIILKKVDTYSLGGVFLYLYTRILQHHIEKGKITYILNWNGKEVNIEDLESHGFTKASATWHEEVAEKISKPYFKLCLQMMHLDPTQRPQLPIALNTYKKKILPQMQVYFTPENIRDHLKAYKRSTPP
jgi:serine/threonine protein kinase